MKKEKDNEEIIDLTPDLSLVWGKVLRKLRENGEHMLHAAAAEINDIEFTLNEIRIYCSNQSLFTLLSKYKGQLTAYAGADVLNILPPVKENVRAKRIKALRDIFGEKIVVKN